MAPRKPYRRQPSRKPNGVSARKTSDGRVWVLVHPRGVRDRAEDIEEVRTMIEQGEWDVATDELRWLLADCSEFVEAHLLLGELAIAAGNDVPLARGHFGCGYQLGAQALRRAGNAKPAPYSQPANRAFHETGRGLAWCLAKLGKASMAKEVADTLITLDPSDPLKLRAMLDELASGGLPIVDLSSEFGDPSTE